MVISLGRCCRHGGGVPQGPDCCSSCNLRGKLREGWVDDCKGMVSDVECVQSLGGREMFSSMRRGISVCAVVVVLMVVVGVVVLIVVVGAVGVVVLTVVMGVVVLMIVVEVLYIGAVEVDCSQVVEIFVLGGFFVVMAVEDELAVGCVVQLALWCSNGKGDFLWCFSLMSVEMNGLSVGACFFGTVIWVDCFVFLERDFVGMMVGTDVVMEVVVEVVVGETVVWCEKI